MATQEWLLWQLADSAFPAGALAHSNGLESAMQHGMVNGAPNLEAFVHSTIRQATVGVLHFVKAANLHPLEYERTDADCDLFLNNHVANRASRAQGRSFLAAADRIFTAPGIRSLAKQLTSQSMPGHLAPVFGIVTGALGFDANRASSLFLFMLARSCIGSAVRLGIVGPLEGQRIQSRIQLPQAQNENRDELQFVPFQTAPMLDLLQGTQDRLYSRLFQS